jgi:hypothetical protein
MYPHAVITQQLSRGLITFGDDHLARADGQNVAAE